MKRNILLIAYVIFGINSLVMSQVTIGSDLKPNKGSLLDLKEYIPDSNNATARKGLLLPRVTLVQLTGNLNVTLGLSDSLSNELHTGLMVYNLADSACPIFPSGVYVWNSLEWEPIGVKLPVDQYSEIEYSDGTGVMTDYEGNSHTTKRFKVLSSNGSVIYNKVWMTQNLRSLKDSQGNWIDCNSGVFINPGYNNTAEIGIPVTIQMP